jgi:uncharacterized protein DUF6504
MAMADRTWPYLSSGAHHIRAPHSSQECHTAHRYGHAIAVTLRRGWPVAFVWRGQEWQVEVIGRWKSQDRWWDATRHAERRYWRVMTADYQTFELPCENGTRWVLDVKQD